MIRRFMCRPRARRPPKAFSRAIVTLVILLNTAFAAAVLWIYCARGTEPTALIAAWFAFTTGELWMLARIKNHELDTINGEAKEGTRDGTG